MKAVAKIACVALLIGALGTVAYAQQDSLVAQRKTPLTIKQVDQANMPATDRALFNAAHTRLARAAQIFGYRMDESGWSCSEVLTKDTPNYLMMICRQSKANGHGDSAFSALIARKGNAVYIVPVMYGGAAPWKTAANMKVSREIFNHVVPAGIAEKAIQPRGDWMTLAMTFTALAGDDSTVLAMPSSSLKWLMAPEPTIMMRNGRPKRTVVFSDVSPVSGVRIWTLTFSKKGRMIAANVQMVPDLKPNVVTSKSPKWKMLKSLPSPVEKSAPLPPTKHQGSMGS